MTIEAGLHSACAAVQEKDGVSSLVNETQYSEPSPYHGLLRDRLFSRGVGGLQYTGKSGFRLAWLQCNTTSILVQRLYEATERLLFSENVEKWPGQLCSSANNRPACCVAAPSVKVVWQRLVTKWYGLADHFRCQSSNISSVLCQFYNKCQLGVKQLEASTHDLLSGELCQWASTLLSVSSSKWCYKVVFHFLTASMWEQALWSTFKSVF